MAKSGATKWIGWPLSLVVLVGVAIVLFANARSGEARGSLGASRAPTNPGAVIQPGLARADLDTLDLQLD